MTESPTTIVERGAAMLDEHMPGWASKIDIGPEQFKLKSADRCILGQLSPTNYWGNALLQLPSAVAAAPAKYGFTASQTFSTRPAEDDVDEEIHYFSLGGEGVVSWDCGLARDLEEAWRYEVRNRQVAEQARRSEAVASVVRFVERRLAEV